MEKRNGDGEEGAGEHEGICSRWRVDDFRREEIAGRRAEGERTEGAGTQEREEEKHERGVS